MHYAHTHEWDNVDGGGVRYCVAFACKVVGTALAVPIPIPSLFCVAFACKVTFVETVLAIPTPDPYRFYSFFLRKRMNPELAIRSRSLSHPYDSDFPW